MALANYEPYTKGENALRDIYISPDNICEISVFYPDHFDVLRDELGISKEEVHDAFSNFKVDEKLMIDNNRRLFANGAFIFFGNKKYIVKTINNDELEHFKRIKDKYFEHMKNNRDSLIV